MPRERSAGAVIFFTHGATKEYLILRYQAGHWDFPKGHIEKGEDEFDTVRREVREETGLGDIVLIPGFEEHTSYFYRKSPKWFFSAISKVPKKVSLSSTGTMKK